MQSIEQYKREASLIIRSDNMELDLSSLAFRFETKFAIITVPKVLKIRIYNVANTTIQQILQEGLQIELSAGYEGNSSMIFSGQIRQISVGKENGTDSFVDIQATDNDDFFHNGFISTTIAAGSTGNQRLSKITQRTSTGEQELSMNIIDNDAQLPRGRVYHGRAKECLATEAAQAGASFYVENGKFLIVDINRYLTQEHVIINRATGMVGLPSQTLQGIEVKCLLNPNIKVGCPVLLDNNSILIAQQNFGISEEPKWELNTNPLNKDGLYKVIAVTHEGSIRGTNWYTNIICFTVDKGTRAQIPFVGQ